MSINEKIVASTIEGLDMSLGSNFNVYNTCLLIIQGKGFDLHVEGELDEDGCYPSDLLWIAQKGDFIFKADNPIELLGLIAIYDHVQPTLDTPYWWRIDGKSIGDQLLQQAFPQISME